MRLDRIGVLWQQFFIRPIGSLLRISFSMVPETAMATDWATRILDIAVVTTNVFCSHCRTVIYHDHTRPLRDFHINKDSTSESLPCERLHVYNHGEKNCQHAIVDCVETSQKRIQIYRTVSDDWLSRLSFIPVYDKIGFSISLSASHNTIRFFALLRVKDLWDVLLKRFRILTECIINYLRCTATL